RLSNYRFPGNVRELENILERAFTLCDNDVITAADIQLNTAPVPGDETDLTQIDSLEDFLDDIERKALTQALEETRWNKTAAARRLGLTFRSLRYRLKKLGLEDGTGGTAVPAPVRTGARPVRTEAVLLQSGPTTPVKSDPAP